MFFLLLVGHAVADFPLQAGPMAAEKCRRSPTDLQRDVPWYYWLTAHAVIHGGAVYLVTGSLFLALLETVAPGSHSATATVRDVATGRQEQMTVTF